MWQVDSAVMARMSGLLVFDKMFFLYFLGA